MPTVTKDVLYPGVFTLANGEQWECTPGMVRAAVVTGNKKLAAGNVSPPLIWEHDRQAFPTPVSVLLSMHANPRQWAGDFAKNTFGYTERLALESVKGEPVAMARLHVFTEPDLRQFAKTRFVSAGMLENHIDPDGRFWPGYSIGHVAATPDPIIQRQRPVMLSAAPARSDRRRSWTFVFLSREYQEGRTMPDDKKPKPGEGDGEGDGLAKLITALGNYGLTIPDGVNDVNALALCVETAAANKGGADAGGGLGDDLDNDNDAANAVSGGGMPALLSSLPDGAKAGVEATVRTARLGLTSRFKRVEAMAVKDGHWTAAQAKDFAKTIETMDGVKLLSAVEKGGQVSRVVREIELMERTYKGKLKDAKNLSGAPTPPGTKPADIPSLETGTPSSEIEEQRRRVKERLAVKRTPAAAAT